MPHRLRSTVAAVMLLAPLAGGLLAQPAAAATARVATPAITTMSLNSDAGLTPGATLRVQLTATANASNATLSLGNSGVTVPLRQQGAGNYTGTYVVRRSDHIDPTQMMTARATWRGRTYSREFSFPPGFQALAAGAAPAASPSALRIERLAMRSVGRIEPGRELHFRMLGTPGGDAWLDIPGVIRGIDLSETRPGVYEGNYTVRRRDDPDAFANATATLRNGNQRATARLDLRSDDRDSERFGGRDNDRDGDRMAGRDRDERPLAAPPGYGERTGGPLPLAVTSHRNNAVVDADGNLSIQGHTAPFANVRVEVQSVANVAGVLGFTQPIADQTVQADRNGNFGVLVTPRGLPVPGSRYDLKLTATSGSQTAEERLTLIPRQG